MASHLPVEIWDEIIGHVLHGSEDCLAFADCTQSLGDAENANFHTIYNLSLVSKALFAVTRRMLYSKFVYSDHGMYMRSHTTVPGARRDLRKCLINVLKEPYLGSQLKFICYQTEWPDKFHCGWTPEVHAPDTLLPREYIEETESILMERARDFARVHFPGGDGLFRPFVEHIKRRCVAAQLVLLIHAAPNLEILNLTAPIDDWCEFFPSMIRTPNGFQPKLRTLVLTAMESCTFFDFLPWMSIVRLPSMRRLHTYGSGYYITSTNAILTIQHLHLIEINQDTADIYTVLQACRALREIKIRYASIWIMVGNLIATPYQCLQHLQHCRDTLEIMDWPFEIHYRRNLIELASFTKLRVAKVAICALFTPGTPPSYLWENSADPYTSGYLVTDAALTRCFPVSIEDVTFYSCARSAPEPIHGEPPFRCDHQQHSKIHALLAFATAAEHRLSRLKKVTYCHNSPDIAEFWVRAVSDAFSAIGVQFQAQPGERYERPDGFDGMQLDI
jgi:hypothetical protein